MGILNEACPCQAISLTAEVAIHSGDIAKVIDITALSSHNVPSWVDGSYGSIPRGPILSMTDFSQ
jgi:hypothetical protein